GIVAIRWDAASDSVGVTSYRLYRDNVLLAEVAGTEYIDTGLADGITYTYEVSALDLAGNESARSVAESITTLEVPAEVESLTASLLQVNGAEQAADGTVRVGTSSTLDLVDEAVAGNQVVGLRFVNLGIPSGAMVSRAYLRFCARSSDSGA